MKNQMKELRLLTMQVGDTINKIQKLTTKNEIPIDGEMKNMNNWPTGFNGNFVLQKSVIRQKRDFGNTRRTGYRRHPILSSETCGVGLSVPDLKLVGGKEAHKGEWPWMVQLSFNEEQRGPGKHLCGGVLISETHILIAAHCFFTSG